MTKNHYATVAFFILIGLLLTNCQSQKFECTDALGCITIPKDAPIQIGVLQVQSGNMITIGQEQVRVIQLATEMRNSELLGHPITLQLEDSRCSPEGGRVGAEKLTTNDQIVGIVGTTCSGAAVEAIKVIAEAGGVLVSGTNSAASLTSIGGQQGVNWQPGYIRTCYNDTVRGQVAAHFVFQELGITRAATIDDGDSYSQGIAQGFAHTFTKLGGNIVVEAKVNKGDSDMGPVLAEIANFNPDMLFIPLYPTEGEALIHQTRAKPELEEMVLMTILPFLANRLIEQGQPHAIGIYYIQATPQLSVAGERFKNTYTQYYGIPETATYAMTYDAINLLLHAIESSAIQEKNGTLHIGKQALRDKLYATQDFVGITGNLSCDAFGDCNAPNFRISRIDKSNAGLTFTTVYTYTSNF